KYVRKMFRGDFLDFMDSNEDPPDFIAVLKDLLPLVQRIATRMEPASNGKDSGLSLPSYEVPFVKKALQHLIFARAKALFKQFGSAADEIGELARINPEGFTYLLHGQTLVEAGRLDEAERAFDLARKTHAVVRIRRMALWHLVSVQWKRANQEKGS